MRKRRRKSEGGVAEAWACASIGEDVQFACGRYSKAVNLGLEPMKATRVFILALLCGTMECFSGDTNFVAAFNEVWRTQNASNIVAFTEANVNTNESAETLFARALAAVYLEKWARGGTNYLGQAQIAVQSNQTYSAEGRSQILELLEDTKGLFEALADDSLEASNSIPQWDTNMHAVVFQELGDEVPFFSSIWKLAEIQ